MRSVAFALAMSVFPAAYGFGVSPCLRQLTYIDGSFGQEKMKEASWVNACDLILTLNFKAAVHEHITLATIAKFRGGKFTTDPRNTYPSVYMKAGPWESPRGRVHETRGIIFGVWWNDDPLRLSWGQGTDFAAGSFNAIGTSVTSADRYPGAGDCNVPARQHLARQSHVGEMQHLHFMTPLGSNSSTAKQRVESTTDLALGWMKFAYGVAIGKYEPKALLTDVMVPDPSLPSVADIAVSNCASEKSVRVMTIFTQRDATWKKLREPLTPEIALGSMLHVMQDSFSPAHACRVRKVRDKVAYAVIADVENYTEQSTSSHRSHDTYPDWLAPRLLNSTDAALVYANDPVIEGAWLMDAVDRRLPWTEVENRLRRTIFLADPQDKASDCIGGRAKRK